MPTYDALGPIATSAHLSWGTNKQHKQRTLVCAVLSQHSNQACPANRVMDQRQTLLAHPSVHNSTPKGVESRCSSCSGVWGMSVADPHQSLIGSPIKSRLLLCTACYLASTMTTECARVPGPRTEQRTAPEAAAVHRRKHPISNLSVVAAYMSHRGITCGCYGEDKLAKLWKAVRSNAQCTHAKTFT